MALFAPAPPNACRAYNNLRNATTGPALEGRHHCDELWGQFEPYADRNFLEEFPLHLHERWFEMYLTVSLLRAGFNVTCPKPGPDVLVTLPNGSRIWIEATCATQGASGAPDSVPDMLLAPAGTLPVVTDRPTQQMVLRISNAVSTKQAVFRDYIAGGIVPESDVTAIAINVHAVRGLWADMGDLMMRSLYGVGDLVLTLDRSTGTVVSTHHSQLTHVEKRVSGASVGVRPFLDGSLPHISAVIGSRADACNLPRRLGDDCSVYPNLRCNTPWPEATFQLGEECRFVEGPDGWDARRVSSIA